MGLVEVVSVIEWAMSRQGAVFFIDVTLLIVIAVRLSVQRCQSNGFGSDTSGSLPQSVSHFLLGSCHSCLVQVVGNCPMRGSARKSSSGSEPLSLVVRSFATLLEVEEA